MNHPEFESKFTFASKPVTKSLFGLDYLFGDEERYFALELDLERDPYELMVNKLNIMKLMDYSNLDLF